MVDRDGCTECHVRWIKSASYNPTPIVAGPTLSRSFQPFELIESNNMLCRYNNHLSFSLISYTILDWDNVKSQRSDMHFARSLPEHCLARRPDVPEAKDILSPIPILAGQVLSPRSAIVHCTTGRAVPKQFPGYKSWCFKNAKTTLGIALLARILISAIVHRIPNFKDPLQCSTIGHCAMQDFIPGVHISVQPKKRPAMGPGILHLLTQLTIASTNVSSCKGHLVLLKTVIFSIAYGAKAIVQAVFLRSLSKTSETQVYWIDSVLVYH